MTVIVDSCLGIEGKEQDDSLVLYPNPTNSKITIEGEGLKDYQNIELRDMTGRLIFVEDVTGPKMTLDLEQLAYGNYFVHIKSAKNSIIRKVQVVQ